MDHRIDVLCVAPDLYLPRLAKPESQQTAIRTRARYRDRVNKEATRILEQALEIMRSEGIEARAVVQTGSPAQTILELSEKYDVTVVGHKGHHDSTKLGLGPVARRAVEQAQGIVIVGRELTADKGIRILVGIDGSLASKAALMAMTSGLNLVSSEITLMHVVETPWIHLGLEDEWFTYPEDASSPDEPALGLQREFVHEAEQLIEAARRTVSKPGVSIETITAEGNAGTELLGQAEQGGYDLVVIGATGLTDYKHSLLGSVSSKLAWAAPCSVMLVRD
jgi:nucleotide-binding universal stress UspA family protein